MPLVHHSFSRGYQNACSFPSLLPAPHSYSLPPLPPCAPFHLSVGLRQPQSPTHIHMQKRQPVRRSPTELRTHKERWHCMCNHYFLREYQSVDGLKRYGVAATNNKVSMFRTYGRISSVTASNLTLHARNLFIDLSISRLHLWGLLHLALKGRRLTFEFEGPPC